MAVTPLPLTGDACIDFYATAWPVQPTGDWLPGSRILEIGCAEADWLGWTAVHRRDLRLVGIDWRKTGHGHDLPNVTVLRGDVLTLALPTESLDGVVMISALEHIGLGHYDADPLDGDGDIHTMQRCVAWLKPGGRVYADVPYQPDAYTVQGTSHREYDDAAIASRIVVPGLVERWRGYVRHGATGDLIAQPTERGTPFYYVALVLEKVA